MCGIAGILYAEPNRPVENNRLEAMSQAIIHRGPDGAGIFTAAGVGLVHRRLSIIDLEGGKQPLGNEDGSIQVGFNGEIYNYRELRSELVAKGHRFATQSDTEVLVHLYEECGERMVERLRGMFAFALWDAPRRRLLLARDRIGIKPLYYYRDAEKLLFCSELKGILAHGNVPRDMDPLALEDYLAYGMISGTRTIFRGVAKLAPAHTLLIEPRQWEATPRAYWQLEFQPRETLGDHEWQTAVREKIEESVERHLVADVPVGAFLSGGIDSSVITALASQRGSSPVQTFSIGFGEAQFNELPYARQVAEKYGTQHREEVVSADAVSLLDQLCWHYDEPFADTSAIPTLLVSRLASQHVKVVLSGDGGDEAFGGYARYAHDLRESMVRRYLPQWLRRGMLAPLASAWPKADWLPRVLRAKTTLTNLALNADVAYANTLAACRLPLRHQLLSADVLQNLNGHRVDARFRHAFHAGNNDPLAGMIATDVATLLPDDYLVKVDRASMAYGLEVRPPLLDHELLELSASIPSRLKIRDGETKWILKYACADLLPPGLMKRPKQGFEVPVDAWLRGPLQPLFQELVLNSSSVAAPWLNLPTIREAFEQHLAGRSRLGQTLWSLMVLCRWAAMFAEETLVPPHRAEVVS